MNKDRGHFTLHVGPTHKEDTPQKNGNEKRDLKTILKDGTKQILVSLLIFVVAFVAMNWRAYYVIAKNEIEKLLGTNGQSELTELVETTEEQKTQQILVAKDESTAKQIKTIPPLHLDITPPDTRLIIPRINENLPVIRVSSENLIDKNWDALEGDMQEALKSGVVHYPGTSLPDQTGNTVVTGHSSYFPWDPGRFKDVFALLHDVVVGDKIALYYNQHKYIYKISNIDVVLPSNLDILKQTPDQKLTLITCTPIGTNLKRLVVTADLIEEQI
jgi:LPXTG-site transpeptidase (sortase) family protein